MFTVNKAVLADVNRKRKQKQVLHGAAHLGSVHLNPGSLISKLQISNAKGST